jgi:negative regulator of replication initiation
MNLPELQQISTKTERASETNNKETVCYIEYLNQHFYKNLRDSIIAQIGACEQLLIKTKWTNERNAIEREILILKLILDLLEY